ncbi:MAG TPA: catechol 2,3-dioxygenase [Patescibacteria group bacterium]|nr:catechol 2,3-dioxygenase [Patescibacteria group bacterium]
MAITGVLRPGFIQLRVLEMDAAVVHYVDRIGLNMVGTGPDGRVYLKARDEFDHHSVVLRKADHAGLDIFAFKVESDDVLTSLTARVEAFGLKTDAVPAGEQPGLGRRVGFVIPSGHRIELYAHADLAEQRPSTLNPDVWEDEPHGMQARRFDHGLLYGPNIGEVEKFFCEVLDFSVTERVDLPETGTLAIWLTCGIKAHDIAFVNHPEPGKFHHVAFELENWNDIGKAADIITRYGISIDIGPTRHGITRGQTIYFFDPSGNRTETYCGGITYYPDNPVRVWDDKELGKGIFYYERALNDRFLTVVT